MGDSEPASNKPEGARVAPRNTVVGTRTGLVMDDFMCKQCVRRMHSVARLDAHCVRVCACVCGVSERPAWDAVRNPFHPESPERTRRIAAYLEAEVLHALRRQYRSPHAGTSV